MTTVMETRVQRGAALLDKEFPEGWESRVHLDILNLSTSSECILGQIYGRYGIGRLELFGISDDMSGCSCPDCDPEGLNNREAINHGVFAADSDYVVLKELWTKEVLQRRELVDARP